MALHLLTHRHCAEFGPPVKAPNRPKPALCIEAKRTLNACAQTRRRIGVAVGGDEPGSASLAKDKYNSLYVCKRRRNSILGYLTITDSAGRGLVIGSAWRWTSFQMPSSNRNKLVTRTATPTNSSPPPTLARPRSTSTTQARSLDT